MIVPGPLRQLARPALRAFHVTRGHGRRLLKRVLRELWRRTDGRHAATFAARLDGVRTRDQIPALLECRGLLADAVEVGVKRGAYSEFLLRHWGGRRLISVDPWREAPGDQYVDRANVAQKQHECYYRETQARLARFGARSEIWRMTSLEAASQVDDRSLDFVYLDARHDRRSVLEDLETWFPKIRPGGIFAGHDYVEGQLPNGDFGVKSAVDDFLGTLGLPVYVTRGRPWWVEIFPSWIAVVPTTDASSDA